VVRKNFSAGRFYAQESTSTGDEETTGWKRPASLLS